MREELRLALDGHDSEYLSVGVNDTGENPRSWEVLWYNTSNAYNMKTPDLYITKEEISDPEVIKKLRSFRVVGFYIEVPLEDYSFLADFPDIFDLNIFYGKNLRDLGFLGKLKRCRMIFLEDIDVPDIDVILNSKRGKKVIDAPFVCVGLYNCKIERVPTREEMSGPEMFFSEFIVWDRPESYDPDRHFAYLPPRGKYIKLKK